MSYLPRPPPVNMLRVTGRPEHAAQRRPWGYGDELDESSLPPSIKAAADRLRALPGLRLGRLRDVTINYRHSGFLRLDPHLDPAGDGENVFVLSVDAPSVLTLSPANWYRLTRLLGWLGADEREQVRREAERQSWTRHDIDVLVPPGAALHLSGDARWKWMHGTRLGVAPPAAGGGGGEASARVSEEANRLAGYGATGAERTEAAGASAGAAGVAGGATAAQGGLKGGWFRRAAAPAAAVQPAQAPGTAAPAPAAPPGLQRQTAAAVVAPACPAASPLCPDGWPLWCLLLSCAAVAQIAEKRTAWGSALSAPLVSMLAAVALAMGGVIPVDCAAYTVVWGYVMPMAAACFLLETDVGRLIRDGGPLLMSFLLGAVGMVAGAAVGALALRGPLEAAGGGKVAACLCASYVGGSVNFAAVAAALHLPPAALPGAMAADNLMMAAFLAALMAVPVNKGVSAAVAAAAAAAAGGAGQGPAVAGAAAAGAAGAGAGAGVEAGAGAGAPAAPAALTAEGLALILAAGSVTVAVSQAAAAAAGIAPFLLLVMAVVATALAEAARWARRRLGGPDEPVFTGAGQVGTALIGVFFAVIGAAAGSLSCLAGAGVLAALLTIMVSVHWVVMVVVGRGLLRLPLEALLLGSNANIGGSATAAAMAAAKGWHHLVQPALVTGSLGYAAGTLAGMAVARLLAVEPHDADCSCEPGPSAEPGPGAAAAASAADAADAVSDSLQCPICSDQLLLPVVTPCGHAYCLDCFEAWRLHAAASYHTVGSLVGRLHCPVCRSPLPRHFNAGPVLPGAGGRAGRAGRSSSGFLSAAMAASAAAAVTRSTGGGGGSSSAAAAAPAAPPLAPCAALGDAIAALCPARHAERLARRREQMQRLQGLKPHPGGGGPAGQRQRGGRRGATGHGDTSGGGAAAAAAAGAGEPWLVGAAALPDRRDSGGVSDSGDSSSGGASTRAPQPHDLVGLPWPLRAVAAPWRRLAGAAQRAAHGLRRLQPPPPLPPPPPQPSAFEVLVAWSLAGIYAASCACIVMAVLEDAGAAVGRGLSWLHRRRRSQPRLWQRLAAAVAAALGGHRRRRHGVVGGGAAGGCERAPGSWRRAAAGRGGGAQQRPQAPVPPWPLTWPAAGGLLPLHVLTGGAGAGGDSGEGAAGSGGLLRQMLGPQQQG
ncbi:hypothetical protein HXX76_011955 [Chlamydomonas incerta]|uniref:RING-type domain-containing protein n=1 Tax=Chlamydomonas incerta TaxID=51695 RepID=A0A835SQP0_CHLIN|nr:hypothetical protein HXX76_011955 [Chlamydomonas incerta]|eukprot:KAG2427968.1 hypothetical protein HXX76_011955 [Chlamydomonas incerta]